jgi:hypothetical protein
MSETLDNENKYDVHLKLDEQTGDHILYRTTNKTNNFGDVTMTPALPNQKIIELVCNNKTLMTEQPQCVQKVLNMEWRYLERRIVKWLGHVPEAIEILTLLRTHIKSEKRWYREKGKHYEIQLR